MSISRSPEQHQQRAIPLPRPLATRKDTPLEPKRDYSTSKSSYSEDKSTSAYTFDEGEVEANLYFPTFARRGSDSRGQLDVRRSSTTSRLLLEQIPAASDEEDSSGQGHSTKSRRREDHDEIFELDDESDDEDSTLTALDYSMHSRSSTVRRISDESSSSTCTNDIGMVWDEGDHDRVEPQPKMMRQGSVSSYVHLNTSPKWIKQGQDTISLTNMPTLPFVRTMRRPSENITTPLKGFQWARGAATKTVSRSNSVTSLQYDPLPSDKRLKGDQRPDKYSFLYSASLSNPSSPQNVRHSPPLLAKKTKPDDFIPGRKRSATDPTIFSSLLDQYRLAESKAELDKPKAMPKVHRPQAVYPEAIVTSTR